MKIAIIGASGFIGSSILHEALERGHEVTAIVRYPEKLKPASNLSIRKGDISVINDVVRLTKNHIAVICAYNPSPDGKPSSEKGLSAVKSIISGVTEAGVKRLLMVGGAGSLVVEAGLQLVDSPDFPPEWKPGATTTRDVLYLLKDLCEIDWTFLSPSALIKSDKRTGIFRLGRDNLLVDSNGLSWISLEDYSMAMIDELEKPKHNRMRFTVGY